MMRKSNYINSYLKFKDVNKPLNIYMVFILVLYDVLAAMNGNKKGVILSRNN